ncbi:MAG: hypothetical protein ACLT98_08235 [Eggerthellaceae bacterium]
MAAEIIRHPRLRDRGAATYGTRIDPSTGYGNGGIQYMLAVEHLQRHPELPRLRQPRGHHRQHGHPGRQPRPDHRPHRRHLQGFSAGLRRHHPAGGSQPSRSASNKFPLLGWWQYGDSHSLWDAVITGDLYPVRALWNSPARARRTPRALGGPGVLA